MAGFIGDEVYRRADMFLVAYRPVFPDQKFRVMGCEVYSDYFPGHGLRSFHCQADAERWIASVLEARTNLEARAKGEMP